MMRFFYRREKNSVKLNYRKHKISITILLLICLQQSQEILCQSVNRLRDLLSLDCCDEVLVSSSGPAEEYQSDRLGVYISVPGRKFNDKPLYKQVDGDDYIYFWIWDNSDGGGHNWLISNNFQQSSHGIESPNMQWETARCEDNLRIYNNTHGYGSQYGTAKADKCPWTCLEHINGLRIPFSAWTRLHRLGGFYKDTTLRIQCWSTAKEEACCNSVRITSRDIGQTVQPERLGIFTSYGETKHGRKVYQKQTPGQRDQFLYFWDWGPNNGGNWFVGLDPDLKPRGIESPDLEKVMYENGICPTQAQLVAPFRVWDNLFAEWKVDNTLRVECVEDPEIECCEYVQIRSTGALRYYHRNAMGNYTSQRQKNNRIVYKHEEQQLFLHYNDFGVLEGTNWMVSKDPSDSIGFLVTQDLENKRHINQCVSIAGEAGPWMVLSDFGWEIDKTVSVTCRNV